MFNSNGLLPCSFLLSKTILPVGGRLVLLKKGPEWPEIPSESESEEFCRDGIKAIVAKHLEHDVYQHAG